MAHATLTPEVEAVLRSCTITENLLVLPSGQLARPLYDAVNKVIVNCGGKWNRFKKGHVFTSDPRAKLRLALDTGVAEDTKKTRQAFYTPAAVAARVVGLADVGGCLVLEPSAGEGALVQECLAQGARAVECIELNEECRAKLIGPGRMVEIADFLTVKPYHTFDRVVMNSPFAKGQDIKHLAHALRIPIRESIRVALLEQDRDTRHACAEAVSALQQDPDIAGSHQALICAYAKCMNTQAI